MLKAQQTQKIYAMAAKAGVLESGNKNDMLHTIVYRLTTKESIRSLDESEYKAVVSELAQMLKLQNLEPSQSPRKYNDSGRGKMSDGQRRKVWQLMYQLEKYDSKQSTAKLGDRLCGIIKKELKIDCTTKQPFRWLTYQQGVTLIEKLKKYVKSAQRRQQIDED